MRSVSNMCWVKFLVELSVLQEPATCRMNHISATLSVVSASSGRILEIEIRRLQNQNLEILAGARNLF